MGKWLAAPVAGRRGDVVALGAVVAAAILMVLSGLVHIHLWDIAYRHVATLGPLFLVQAIAALVMAVVLVVARAVVVALACIALDAGHRGRVHPGRHRGDLRLHVARRDGVGV